jgi:serine/threonine-protein kinase haspin
MGSPLVQTQPPSIPGIWSEYTPKTNLIWLFFLLKTMLKNKKPEHHPYQPPRHSSRDPLQPCPTSRTNIQKPRSLSSKPSSMDIIALSENTKKQLEHVGVFKQKLFDRLNKVLELLDLESGHEDMCCAADLVAYAIDSKWLSEEDFFLS